MAIHETEALVLRTYNLAEADKIVVCLSRSAGLIRGVAKGCRKLRNRFGASLEPFTLINLTYFEKENQELVSFSQTEILRSRFNLSGNASILTGFAYMGDLLIDFHPELNNVLLVGAGSGHGFKHGPAVGRYAAELLTGRLARVEPRFSFASKGTAEKREVH